MRLRYAHLRCRALRDAHCPGPGSTAYGRCFDRPPYAARDLPCGYKIGRRGALRIRATHLHVVAQWPLLLVPPRPLGRRTARYTRSCVHGRTRVAQPRRRKARRDDSVCRSGTSLCACGQTSVLRIRVGIGVRRSRHAALALRKCVRQRSL